MSVLIKGLAMPDCCWNCPCCDDEYGECNISGEKIKIADGRLTDCPLIELPDHGDLIDKDELMKHGVYIRRDGGYMPVVYMSYVKGAKTVIPAEGSEASPCDDCDERSDVGCSWCRRMERSEE